MTKKHSMAIASILNNYHVRGEGERLQHQRDIVLAIAEALSIEFKANNPRFDRNLFINACVLV